MMGSNSVEKVRCPRIALSHGGSELPSRLQDDIFLYSHSKGERLEARIESKVGYEDLQEEWRQGMEEA